MRENASDFWAKRLGLFRQVQNVCRQLSSVIPGMPVRLAGSTERGEKGKRKSSLDFRPVRIFMLSEERIRILPVR